MRRKARSGSNFSSEGDDGDAVVERREQRVEQAADPGPVRGRPETVARLREEVVVELEPGR